MHIRSLNIMGKNRRHFIALCALGVMGFGCSDDSGKHASCEDIRCPAGSTCSEELGQCVPDSQKCPQTPCAHGTVCNETTGVCEAEPSNRCPENPCPDGTVCNPSTGLCTSNDTDLCKNTECPANTTCNPNTGVCDPISTDLCKDVQCPSGSTCDPDTGDCKEKKPCNGMTCDPGFTLNPAICKCEGGPQYECLADTDCKSDPEIYTYPEYCDLSTHTCQNANCKGKTWDPEYQYCSVTGKIVCYENRCGDGDIGCDCNGVAECDTSTHYCKADCSFEDEGNIILNWSFEDWNGSALKNWTLVDNSYANGGNVVKSKKSSHCSTAAELQNDSTKIARLEGDPIDLPDPTFIDGNRKYDCSIQAFGEGVLNLGFRTLDAEGKEIAENTTAQTKTFSGSSSYQKIEFKMSISPEAKSVQPLLGFRKSSADTNASITVDALSCIAADNICNGVTCESWEICSLNGTPKPEGGYIGTCKPLDGYCSVNNDKTLGCAANIETCNTTTHRCESIEGSCATHAACPTGQKCDTASHKCVEGDRCEGVTCSAEYRACDPITAACTVDVAHNRCLRSSDCLKDNPVCDPETHTCVPESATSSTGKPLNIVPNGSFEEWDEITIGEYKPVTYTLPTSWYGTEENFYIYPTHLVSELDMGKIHPYSAATHSGDFALQIDFTTQPAKRFTSFGFDVPAGSFDCSYWVRGKGQVRIHSFSSRGEQSKTEFTTIDSLEWTRIPFDIKSSSSDMRLVFYVSNTDAAKDHIQIDDVVCVPWNY